MHEIQVLNDRLDVLIKRYQSVAQENRELRDTVSRQLAAIQQLNAKLASLEEELLTVQLGKVMLQDTDKTAMKKQLDGVIAAIDKILATLND